MKANMAALIAGIALLILVLPLQAHHPFAAQYDKDKPVTMTGTVTKVDWANPHAHLFMDARDSNGKMENWEFELGSIKKLRSLGWKRDSIKMGDQVTVDAWLSKTKDDRANVKSVKLSDGRELSGASSITDVGTAKNKPISN